ncbi:MAG: heparinase II/III family protein [Pseudomonadota bacterium]
MSFRGSLNRFTALLVTGSIIALAACERAETIVPSPVRASAAQTASIVPSAASTPAGLTFENTVRKLATKVDAQMAVPIAVPAPKDAGGGYTHEQHKLNAKTLYNAGQLYRFTGEPKYAAHAEKLFLAYAAMYPGLGFHPEKKEQSPGRLFWQNLNESWWLVHAIQGYASVKDKFSAQTRETIETDLLRPMALFLSEGSPSTFNKIHNHGTWATAAVGMTGYVLGDDTYVKRALLGLDQSGDYGFLKQLEVLFSPDGYYNEGPYYQRYALMPFVLFGQAIEANEPARNIFQYRDGILQKAIYATIQQNYGKRFFPINDALKDKDIATTELQYGVAIAYDLTGDPGLLAIAQAQGEIVPTRGGQKLAEAIATGKTKPFAYRSMRLRDGTAGDNGALDILRASERPDDLTVVIKNTAQGLGHGHFDKLGILVYDAGYEIIRDYGAARFLNVEAKYGGHYLPENNSFAKQTIAHNTLSVDGKSHFDGRTKEGNKHAPVVGAFVSSENLQATTARIDTAYDGVTLARTVAIVEDPALAKPVILDLMTAQSSMPHHYDLPFYFNGHLVETNVPIQVDTQSRMPLGAKNGYQHLWRVGQGPVPGGVSAAGNDPDTGLAQMTWLLDRRFYSVTSSMPAGASVVMAQIGANDPDFNLRNELAFIYRMEGAKRATIASVIEPHGEYNPTVEYTVNSHSAIASIAAFEGAGASLIELTTKAGARVALGVGFDTDENKSHRVEARGETHRWTGPYHLFPSRTNEEEGN